MSDLAFRWKIFWSRRSRRRIAAALMLFILSVLAAVYLVLPAYLQAWVTGSLAVVWQTVGALDTRQLLVSGVALLCVTLCARLVIVPSSVRREYLMADRSIIPPVSVYVDAENQLHSESSIRPFMNVLSKHLDGRRADLLYFLDASRAAMEPNYRPLYRAGFRLVDVPHYPTGEGMVKEAVDRELALHAYERALRGPVRQEFILVTGDGDYVALIYRLAALGHRVQVWGTPMHRNYAELATYLTGVDVQDLGDFVPELRMVATDHEVTPAGPQLKLPPEVATRIVPPVGLALPGEEQIYHTIARTRVAHARCREFYEADRERSAAFRALLSSELAGPLANIGYGAAKSSDYWLDHLVALGVFAPSSGQYFPADGTSTSEEAARALHAAFQAAAQAAVRVIPAENGTISMYAILRVLTGALLVDLVPAPLQRLLMQSGNKANGHVRCFVRGARAVRLLTYRRVVGKASIIRSPRLLSAQEVSPSP